MRKARRAESKGQRSIPAGRYGDVQVSYVLDGRKVVATVAALSLFAGAGTALAMHNLTQADAHETQTETVSETPSHNVVEHEWQGPERPVVAEEPAAPEPVAEEPEPVEPAKPSPEEVAAAEKEAALAWRDSDDIDRADLRISTPGEIQAWAERIDAYLDGTVLAGYGSLFAECAAEYQVDPRLSPAISRLESGCGAVCAAPHNAWGWGGPGGWRSWDSWEEAIRGHISGLANGGYASMGPDECAMYCDYAYWDGDPGFCLKTEILKI